MAFGDFSSGANVFNPAVGARTDEDLVDLDIGHRHAGGKPHVVQSVFSGSSFQFVLEVCHHRYVTGDRSDIFRAGPPGDLRHDIRDVQRHFRVVNCAFVRGQGLPVIDRRFPLRALRRHGPAFDVFEGRFVWRHETGTRSAFNGHVADRHAPFHGKVTNRLTCVFDGAAGAAGGTNFTN